MKKSRIRVIRRKRRKIVLGGVLCASLVFLLGYLATEYQVIQKLLFVKEEIKGAEEQAASERGTIYDRYYVPLAENRTKVGVYCRSREVDDPEAFIMAVSAILPINSERLRAQFDMGELRIWLLDGIDVEQERRLKAAKVAGLYFSRQNQRYYPQGELTSHLIGVVDEDVGVVGLEYYFDKLLTGSVKQEYDRIGGTQDLVLSLDLKIQRSLQKLLMQVVDKSNVARIAGYVVDTKTGGLVAGMQWPSYNPSDYDVYSQTVLENLFLQNVPIPQKLQDALVTSASLFKSSEVNKYQIPWSIVAPSKSVGTELRLWNDLGLDDLVEPDFATSRILKGDVARYVSLLPPQRESTLPSTLTPLQMLMALARLAHGEGNVQPHVVEKVMSRASHEEVVLRGDSGRNTSVFSKGGDEVGRFIASPAFERSDANYMLNFFQVVTSDDAKQLVGQEFVFSFAPTPQADLAMLLVVERNSNVVGPKAIDTVAVVANMLARVASLQQIAAVMGEGVEKPQLLPNEYLAVAPVKEVEKQEKQVVFSTEPMPNLTGLSLRKSLKILNEYNCKIQVEGTGWVSSQYPPKGSNMNEIHTCRISLQNPEALSLSQMAKKARGDQS